MLLFWEKGLAATSLDDLAIAMQMNRPSIYNAFGNKEAIYRAALARFCGQLDGAVEGVLEATADIKAGLIEFYDQAIEVYCGDAAHLGCLMVCTAPAEAMSHPEVAEDLRHLITRLDEGLAKRVNRAMEEGQVSRELSAQHTAQMLQATLQTIALRARAGTPKRSLKKLARFAVNTLLQDK